MKVRIILLLASLFTTLYTIPCGNSYRTPDIPDVYTKGNTLHSYSFIACLTFL
jgi:hypothetical protein